MYAIFRAKGKQFRAEPEATLRIPSLDAEPGDTVRFEEVLLAEEGGGELRVGTPALAGASVEAEVVRHGKDEKIVVFKQKRRKGYRRKQGHRQKFTEIRILGIDLGDGRAAEQEAEPAAIADVDITDAARALAEEHEIDVTAIEGTGKDGRILKADVQQAIDEREAEEADEG